MTHLALEVKNVTKSYPVNLVKRTAVINDVSFAVNEGEIVSFIGVNGAGKTSLLKLLVGITQPDIGSIALFGQSICTLAAKNKLGFMPESPFFFADLTANQLLNILQKLPDKKTNQTTGRTTADLLHLVGLQEQGRKAIRLYSKGLRQRLGFAQALIGNPKIVFLDEPLDGLDPIGRQELKRNILELKKAGQTVILCSHILSDIDEISDRIGIIHQGQLVKLTKPAEFKKQRSLEDAFCQFIKEQNR